MTRKLLTALIFILVLVLAVFLVASDRSISSLMEDLGKFIARFFD